MTLRNAPAVDAYASIGAPENFVRSASPVRNEPGSTKNARKPIGSISCPIDAVKPSRAHLLEEEKPFTGRLAMPSIAETVTLGPSSRARNSGRDRRIRHYAPA